MCAYLQNSLGVVTKNISVIYVWLELLVSDMNTASFARSHPLDSSDAPGHVDRHELTVIVPETYLRKLYPLTHTTTAYDSSSCTSSLCATDFSFGLSLCRSHIKYSFHHNNVCLHLYWCLEAVGDEHARLYMMLICE